MKKLLALALCAALFVTLVACGADVPGESKAGDKAGSEAAARTHTVDGVTYGRYVEEDITPPGLLGSVRQFYYDEAGLMDLVTQEYNNETREESFHRYRSSDNGESWQELDMTWASAYTTDYTGVAEDEEPDTYININNLEILKSGEMIFTVSTYVQETQEETNEIYTATLEGEVSEVEIPVLKELAEAGDGVYIYNMHMLDGDRILLTGYVSSGARVRYSTSNDGELGGVFDIKTGEQLVDFSADSWNMFYNDTAYYVDTGNIYEAYSLETGEKLNVELPESEQLWKNNIYPYDDASFVTEEHVFYGMNSKGIMRMGAGMEDPELVMEGLNYSFGSPACWVRNVYYNNDEILMAAEEEYDGSLLLRYTWDDDAVASSDKVLSVYSLYENEGVRLALSQFKKQNPEVSVQYESPLYRGEAYNDPESEPAITPEDALRALSVELLAGNGPDVLILDDLPLQSYMDKGILEDISDVADGIEVYDAVLDGLRVDGKLYAVPANFSVPMMFGRAGGLEEYSDFDAVISAIVEGPVPSELEEPDWDDLQSKGEEEQERIMMEYWETRSAPVPYDERPVMHFDSLDELVSIFYEISAPAIYTEAGGLDKEALKTYLEAVKAVSDKYRLTEDLWSEKSEESYIISMGGTGYAYSSSLEQYATQRTRLGYTQFNYMYTPFNIASYEYNARFVGITDEDGRYVEEEREDYEPQFTDGMLARGMAEGVYFPMGIAGVCSTSGEKELAKEFVATMLGYDVQKYNWYGTGLPVNKEAFASRWEEANSNNDWLKENGLEPPKLDIDTLFAGLETPYFTNEYLLQVIYDNTVPMCRGQISVDDAASAIEKETGIYFAERQ